VDAEIPEGARHLVHQPPPMNDVQDAFALRQVGKSAAGLLGGDPGLSEPARRLPKNAVDSTLRVIRRTAAGKQVQLHR